MSAIFLKRLNIRSINCTRYRLITLIMVSIFGIFFITQKFVEINLHPSLTVASGYSKLVLPPGGSSSSLSRPKAMEYPLRVVPLKTHSDDAVIFNKQRITNVKEPSPDSADRPPQSILPRPTSKPSYKGKFVPTHEEVKGGQPYDEDVVKKRDHVRNMMLHAWNGYKKYAWGQNEYRPVSHEPHNPSLFGMEPLGTTIVDSLDTLFMMGLDAEYRLAREWVKESLNFDQNTYVSVFEFNIRYVGGLLSIYSMTGDKLYLTKTLSLVKRLVPAFSTRSGLPVSLINLHDSHTMDSSWVKSQCSILAEVGTLHMEFTYLSELTNTKLYANLVKRVRKTISAIPRPLGILYHFINHDTGEFCSNSAGMGAYSDSFYEYLLKEWLRSGKRDTEARALYDSLLGGFEKVGALKRNAEQQLHIPEYSANFESNRMDHLSCFAGGMFALGANDTRDKWFKNGVDLTETCHLSYASTVTKLGPEIITFNKSNYVISNLRNSAYLLRPETVESYFYLWRLTKNQKYRDWAWDVVNALDEHCRTDAGYSGLTNVNLFPSVKDDVQPSYFLAETLKYLYLIFSEDSLLPLDRWVFNTEAHPLPIIR